MRWFRFVFRTLLQVYFDTPPGFLLTLRFSNIHTQKHTHTTHIHTYTTTQTHAHMYMYTYMYLYMYLCLKQLRGAKHETIVEGHKHIYFPQRRTAQL